MQRPNICFRRLQQMGACFVDRSNLANTLCTHTLAEQRHERSTSHTHIYFRTPSALLMLRVSCMALGKQSRRLNMQTSAFCLRVLVWKIDGRLTDAQNSFMCQAGGKISSFQLWVDLASAGITHEFIRLGHCRWSNLKCHSVLGSALFRQKITLSLAIGTPFLV